MTSRLKSTKTMATATATLVVQGEGDLDPAEFERAVESTGVLRRAASIEVKRHGETIELHCPVEYGPVIGGYESDIRRQLSTIMARMNGAVEDGAVFHFRRTEVTAERMTELLADLDRRVDDPTLSLAARRNLSITVARLRARFTESGGGR